jgi:membrane fusion protein (multidrug efflux system)
MIIFSFIFLVGFFLRPEEKEKNKNSITSSEVKKEIKKPAVKTEKSVFAPLIEKIQATGKFRGQKESDLRPRISGILKKINVYNGQLIKKDQIIFELNHEKIDLEILKKESKLLEIKEDLELRLKEENLAFLEEKTSVKNIRDFKKLKEKLFSKNDKIALLKQRLGYTEVYLNLLELKLERSFHFIKAPFAGKISELNISEGHFISTAEKIAKLTKDDFLIARVGVLEADAEKIKIGAKVELINSDIFGKVIGIDAKIDDEKKLVQVDVLFENKQEIRSGKFAKVLIHSEINKAGLLVKKEAILERDGKSLLFIARENKAVWCYVKTGKENNEFVEILSSKMDLKTDENVIVDGQFSLAHNAEIEVEND